MSHKEHSVVRPHGCKKSGCFEFQSDFACISCDQKFEEHETIYETEKERQQAGKPIREDFLPLAQNPEVQKQTMIKLGIDDRTPEEKFLDEMRLEEEKKLNNGMLNLQLSDGQNGRPQVNLIVNTNKNQVPKQNLQKPEKSIQLMQERGIAGQRKPINAIKAGPAKTNQLKT